MNENYESFRVSLRFCGDVLPVDEVAALFPAHDVYTHRRMDYEPKFERDAPGMPPIPCAEPRKTNVCVIYVTYGPDAWRVQFQEQIASFLPEVEAHSDTLSHLLSLPGVTGHFSLQYSASGIIYGFAYLSPEQLIRIGQLGLGVIVTLYRIGEGNSDEDKEEEETPYPCPCCGFLVFEEAAGSFSICPVCNWEDDPVQLRCPTMAGGANVFSLWQAQQHSLKSYPLSVRETQGFLHFVRDQNWRPLTSEELVTEGAPQTRQEYFEMLREESPAYYWVHAEQERQS